MSRAKKKLAVHISKQELLSRAEAHKKDPESPAELMFTKFPAYETVCPVFGGLAAALN